MDTPRRSIVGYSGALPHGRTGRSHPHSHASPGSDTRPDGERHTHPVAVRDAAPTLRYTRARGRRQRSQRYGRWLLRGRYATCLLRGGVCVFDVQREIVANVHRYASARVDCLQSFTDVERLTGDDQYYCESCRSKQDALKKFTLSSLPPVRSTERAPRLREGALTDADPCLCVGGGDGDE